MVDSTKTTFYIIRTYQNVCCYENNLLIAFLSMIQLRFGFVNIMGLNVHLADQSLYVQLVNKSFPEGKLVV